MKACRYRKTENAKAAFRAGFMAVLLMGLVLAVTGLPRAGMMRAEAAERPVMTQEELDKTDCSISVTMKTDDPDAGVIPLGGGEIELFRLAGVKVDNGFRFVYEGDFAGLAGNPDYKAEDDADLSPDLAQMLEEYVDVNEIAGDIRTVPETGVVDYTGLKLGLYLVRQKEPAPNYAPAAPFLVTIPLYDSETNVNIFNVNAFPKASPAKRLGPCTADPPIRKKLKVDGTPSETAFLFRFERQNSAYPMPVNTDGSEVSRSGNEMILRIDADTPDADGNLTGEAEAGDITFHDIGDYYYLLSEIDSASEGVTYDPVVYWFKYEIRYVEGSDTLKCTRILVKSGDEDGPVIWDKDKNPDAFIFEFNNEFEEKEDPTDPTDTTEVDPTDPKPTDPTDPKPTDPTDPKPTDPTDPKPTDPTDPKPTDPTDPKPTDPTDPRPTDPTDPKPTDPTDPKPTDPTDPKPTDPTEPTQPTQPTRPTEPTQPSSSGGGGGGRGGGDEGGDTPYYPSAAGISISYEMEAPEVAGAERVSSLLGTIGRQSGLGGMSRLPQTGQLWWPVPVLGILGMAMILGGILMLGKGKKK